MLNYRVDSDYPVCFSWTLAANEVVDRAACRDVLIVRWTRARWCETFSGGDRREGSPVPQA
jgi:hypothetical protein